MVLKIRNHDVFKIQWFTLLIILLLNLISLGLHAQDLLSDNQGKVYLCESLLGEQSLTTPGSERSILSSSSVTVWKPRTQRNFAAYLRSLRAINQSQAGRAFLPLPKFSLRRALAGESKILSLGEGDSDFIKTLIDHRRDQGLSINEITTFHAVDLQFQHISAFYRFAFHEQAFQHLDIRNQKGERIQFDEIISSWSLSFVLNESDPIERAHLLDKIMDHLAPGGVVRIWPPPVRVKSDLQKWIRKMSQEGEIVNWWLGEAFVFQKRE